MKGQVRAQRERQPVEPVSGRGPRGREGDPAAGGQADRPFRIKSIIGDKGAFEIPATPSDAKETHIVPVTFIASPTETGKVVKTIHIETDLGDAKATSYAVVNEGEVTIRALTHCARDLP